MTKILLRQTITQFSFLNKSIFFYFIFGIIAFLSIDSYLAKKFHARWVCYGGVTDQEKVLCYDAFILLGSNEADDFFQLGASYYRLGQYRQAIAPLQRAINSKADKQYYQYLIKTYEALGKKKQTENFLQKMNSRFPQ